VLGALERHLPIGLQPDCCKFSEQSAFMKGASSLTTENGRISNKFFLRVANRAKNDHPVFLGFLLSISTVKNPTTIASTRIHFFLKNTFPLKHIRENSKLASPLCDWTGLSEYLQSYKIRVTRISTELKLSLTPVSSCEVSPSA
jgi:hypothetical protein